MGRGLGLPTVLPEEALCRLPKGCEAPCDPNLIQSQRASSIDVHRVAPGCRCAKAGEHLLAARDTAPESLLPFPPGWMLLALMEETPGGQSLPQILVWAPNMAAPHPNQCHQAILLPRPRVWHLATLLKQLDLIRGQTQELGFPRTARDTSTSFIQIPQYLFTSLLFVTKAFQVY